MRIRGRLREEIGIASPRGAHCRKTVYFDNSERARDGFQNCSKMNASARKIGYPQVIFLAVVAIDVFLLFWFMLIDDSATASFLFDMTDESWPKDSFMDFFNSIWDAQVRGCDGEYHSIYPPLINMFYLVIAKMIPGDITQRPASDLRSGASGGVAAPLLYAVITVIAIVLIVLLIRKSFRGDDNVLSSALSVAFLFSLPILYTVERGNSMIICLLFLLVFFIFKDEQSQWKRFLACLSLAVAINIKLYPAIFLLVFVVDRRWRDLGVAIAMAALLFAVPLCYFKGIETLVELYHNLVSTTATMAGLGFGQKLNLSNTIAFTIAFLSGDPFAFVPSRLINLFLLGTTMIVCCILFFKRTVFSKSDFTWKLALLLASFIVLYPGFSYVYNLCFILPALALFLADRERMDRSTVVYLALFLLAILPIPFSVAAIAPWMDVAMASVSGGVTVYPMSLTCYVNSIAVAALWGITALSLCVQAFRNSPMRNRA